MTAAFSGVEVGEEIGRLCTGTVLAARQPGRTDPVALVLLADALAEDRRLRGLLRLEVARAAGLRHPAIARPLEVREDGGRLGVIVAVPAGTALGRLPASDIPSGGRVASCISRLAAGLDAAHARRLFVGDISPSSVIVGSDGTPVALGVGLLSAVTEAHRALAAGLPRWEAGLAPELHAGEPPTAAGDGYALGALAYLLIVGIPPAAASSTAADAEIPTGGLGSPLPGAVSDVLRRQLAIDPSARYPTCAAFAAALTSALVPTLERGTPPDEAAPAVLPATALPRPTPREQVVGGTDPPLPRHEIGHRTGAGPPPSAAGHPGGGASTPAEARPKAPPSAPAPLRGGSPSATDGDTPRGTSPNRPRTSRPPRPDQPARRSDTVPPPTGSARDGASGSPSPGSATRASSSPAPPTRASAEPVTATPARMAPLRGHLGWGIAGLLGSLVLSLPLLAPIAMIGPADVSGMHVVFAMGIALFWVVPAIFKVAGRYGAVRAPDMVRVRGPVVLSVHPYEKGKPSANVYLADGRQFPARDLVASALRKHGKGVPDAPVRLERDRVEAIFSVEQAIVVYSRAANIIIEILDADGREIFAESSYKYHGTRRR